MAFHKALSDRARDPSVIAAFVLAVNNGGDIAEAVKIARVISQPNEENFPELLKLDNLDEMELRDEVLCFAGSVNHALSEMTDENAVSKAMAKYPQAPYSDLVTLSKLLIQGSLSRHDCNFLFLVQNF